ncbi:MAG: heat-inducible transcriptional repressor HrcA [Pyramidobacter sp.]
MLTERQLEIVFAVVYEYIKTGEPVGSRTISRKFLKNHSAATIRNEMSDLEEMGYFTQPHSSAGRLPTSMAYRVYVNSILHRPSVPPPEIARWIQRLSGQLQSFDEQLAEAARFLGRFTRCFSVAAVAPLESLKLRKADLIRLLPDILLLLLVVENGTVHHRRVRISPDVTQEELETFATAVNRMASDTPWNGVRSSLERWLRRSSGQRWNLLRPIFEEIDGIMTGEGMTVSTGGVREVLTSEVNEEADERRVRIKAISNLMDTREDLEQFITDYAADEGLKVTIGDENESPVMQGCSVMVSTATGGGRKSMVGLVGPLRMNYANSIAVLEAVLDGLSRIATEKEDS